MVEPLTIDRKIHFEGNRMIMSFDEVYQSGKIVHVELVWDSEKNKMTRFADGKLDFEWDGADNVLHVPKSEICPLCGAIKGGESVED